MKECGLLKKINWTILGGFYLLLNRQQPNLWAKRPRNMWGKSLTWRLEVRFKFASSHILIDSPLCMSFEIQRCMNLKFLAAVKMQKMNSCKFFSGIRLLRQLRAVGHSNDGLDRLPPDFRSGTGQAEQRRRRQLSVVGSSFNNDVDDNRINDVDVDDYDDVAGGDGKGWKGGNSAEAFKGLLRRRREVHQEYHLYSEKIDLCYFLKPIYDQQLKLRVG